MRPVRVAAVLALASGLAPALLDPRPALLGWAWEVAPWIVAAAAGWGLALLWTLRCFATLLLRTPGRRLNEALGEEGDA